MIFPMRRVLPRERVRRGVYVRRLPLGRTLGGSLIRYFKLEIAFHLFWLLERVTRERQPVVVIDRKIGEDQVLVTACKDPGDDMLYVSVKVTPKNDFFLAFEIHCQKRWGSHWYTYHTVPDNIVPCTRARDRFSDRICYFDKIGWNFKRDELTQEPVEEILRLAFYDKRLRDRVHVRQLRNRCIMYQVV